MFVNDKNINTEKIINISKQIKSGAQFENPTIELKREFWDLSKDEGKNEYAKDLTVMANSQYGGGNIIVGIDGKTGDLHQTTLPLDAAKLADIINRKVLEPFTVEFKELLVDGKNIIVIHIPRSYNKPHMLREYKTRQMFIPMRKGTRTVSADKYDLDLMYTERDKDVIPPYRLEPFLGKEKLIISPSTTTIMGHFSLNCSINIINTGSRINLITGGSLLLYSAENKEIAKLELTSYINPISDEAWTKMENGNYLKIPPNDVLYFYLAFTNEDALYISGSPHLAQITLYDLIGNASFTKTVEVEMLKDDNMYLILK